MLWIKAFHIIFMVTWFAGLFYLPRLFVYHADATDSISNERFKIMERKLFIIMTIGAVGAAIFGLWLMFSFTLAAHSGALWLHSKMFLVLLLIAYHGYCYKLVLDFRNDRNIRSHKFYRWINEFPALILIGVILLVVLKPF